MDWGCVRALDRTPSFCVSQACTQASPSAGAPWYDRLGSPENDLQSPAELWLVHRGL